MLRDEVHITSFLHHARHGFVVNRHSSSALAAIDLHVAAGGGGDQFIFGHLLPEGTFVRPYDLRLYAEVQGVIDRGTRYTFCLACLLQLRFRERLLQVAQLLQHHIAHRRFTQFVGCDIIA